MNALISPSENVIDVNTGEVIGERVAEVCQQPFEVAPPLFWMACAEDVQADVWYFDTTSQELKLTPQYVPPVIVQPTTSGSQTL